MDFEPVTRIQDPIPQVSQDTVKETKADIYGEEDKLFEKRKKRYQPDKEMELGFPDENQEFIAKSSLTNVIDEYNSFTKGRQLKPLKQGMGLYLYGDPDLFY